MTDRDEQSRAARRELERLNEEGGLFSTPGLKARARSLRGHFTAEDAERDDPVEVWGTRIGRGLAAVALVVLAIWLFGFLGR